MRAQSYNLVSEMQNKSSFLFPFPNESNQDCNSNCKKDSEK